MLSSVHLTHFRNYTHAEVEFASGMNCISGKNGQGKSNLLEAVYYLSLLRSFRTSDVNDMRQVGADSFVLRGRLTSGSGPDTVISVMYGAERRLQVNSSVVYRASDFINSFICITFIPQDLFLVQGTPSQRRRFLDIAISQVVPDYMKHLQAYNQALKSRNMMLRDQQKYPRSTVTAYDTMLAKEGSFIECRRREFIDRLNAQLDEYSGRLLQDSRKISLKYLVKQGFLFKAIDGGEEELEAATLKLLEAAYEHDIKSGTTSVGPHRSDFRFLMDENVMENYSSQGECRMASLALKLACLEVVRQSVDESGILLLIDDVIGELDASRRRQFFEATRNVGQSLLACTEIPAELNDVQRQLHVVGGEISYVK